MRFGRIFKRDCNRNFRWASIYWVTCPIYNLTAISFKALIDQGLSANFETTQVYTSTERTVYSVTSSLPALGFAAKRNNYFSWKKLLAKFRFNLFREKRRNFREIRNAKISRKNAKFREKNCETFRLLQTPPGTQSSAMQMRVYAVRTKV